MRIADQFPTYDRELTQLAERVTCITDSESGILRQLGRRPFIREITEAGLEIAREAIDTLQKAREMDFPQVTCYGPEGGQPLIGTYGEHPTSGMSLCWSLRHPDITASTSTTSLEVIQKLLQSGGELFIGEPGAEGDDFGALGVSGGMHRTWHLHGGDFDEPPMRVTFYDQSGLRVLISGQMILPVKLRRLRLPMSDRALQNNWREPLVTDMTYEYPWTVERIANDLTEMDEDGEQYKAFHSLYGVEVAPDGTATIINKLVTLKAKEALDTLMEKISSKNVKEQE